MANFMEDDRRIDSFFAARSWECENLSIVASSNQPSDQQDSNSRQNPALEIVEKYPVFLGLREIITDISRSDEQDRKLHGLHKVRTYEPSRLWNVE